MFKISIFFISMGLKISLLYLLICYIRICYNRKLVQGFIKDFVG